MSLKDNKTFKILVQILAVLVILAAGAGLFKALTSFRKPPERKEREVAAPLLEGRQVAIEDMQMVVRGFGTVQPRTQVNLVPQVSGRVVELHPNFVNGGFFKADEPLVVIDQRDYRLAVENARAAVASAQVRLEQEQAEAAVAREEWTMLHPEQEPSSPLVLREPQIRQARAQLQAAEAQLSRAQLDLERTVITLPFAGRIESRSVDVGQFVTVGQPVATVYGTNLVEIVVPLEDRELQWFTVPLDQGADSTKSVGSAAKVIADFAGESVTWNGYVARMQGRVDERNRMVNVVVEVENPFDGGDGRPPLTPGMFVEVAIQGRELDDAVRIPRYALRQGRYVWIENGGALEIVEVQIARLDDEYAYISQGLDNGAVVLTSPLDTATEGMAIRTELPEAVSKVQTQEGDNQP